MRPWRAGLVAGLTGMAGFVGGVWFVSSEWAFRLIRLPSVPSVSSGSRPGGRLPGGMGIVTSKLSVPARPKVEAVGVPPLWSISSSSGGLGFPVDRSDLLPGPGCSWEVEPRDFTSDAVWHRTNVERLLMGTPAADLRTRQFRYQLTQVTRPGKGFADLRVVLFDAAGNRYPGRSPLPGGTSSNNQEAIQFRTFDWDDLPPFEDTKGVYFGIERVPTDDQRLAAEAARAEAMARKVELLPPPRIGEPFPIDLALAEGGRVRATDLKGRAVLVVVTGPGSQGPFSLKMHRKEFPPEDLAVVNVSFDGDLEAARATRDRLGEPAPLVLVPNDPVARRLWREGAELPYLPTCWLVDRAGVLRFQSQWFDLDDRIATTLGRPTRIAKFQAISRESVAKAQVEARARTKAATNAPAPPPISKKPAPTDKP